MSSIATYSLISFAAGILSALVVVFANPRFTLQFIVRFLVGGAPQILQNPSCSNGVITFQLDPAPELVCDCIKITSFLNDAHDDDTHTPGNAPATHTRDCGGIPAGTQVTLKVRCEYAVKIPNTMDAAMVFGIFTA